MRAKGGRKPTGGSDLSFFIPRRVHLMFSMLLLVGDLMMSSLDGEAQAGLGEPCIMGRRGQPSGDPLPMPGAYAGRRVCQGGGYESLRH